MAIKRHNGAFGCSICGKDYVNAPKADLCRDSHKMIYFPITKDELNNLMIAIHTGDMSVLSDNLLDRLEKYKRVSLHLD